MLTTDALVIGAGPVGLFQVFQLGLHEMAVHLVDALPYPGGQCAELYADKPIYDIPGIPVCTGRELTERLLQQIGPFQAPMHLGQHIEAIEPLPDGGWRVTSSTGMQWAARVVVVAAGVGAFVPRKPAVPGLDAFETGAAAQVGYHALDANACAGQQVVVMGGEDAALTTALQLANAGVCARVTLLHRVARYSADPTLQSAVTEAIAQGRLHALVGQPVGFVSHEGRLTGLRLSTPDTGDHDTIELPADRLLPRLGLSPKLGPVAQWGLQMERKQIAVDPATFATSAQGIFAVGDINTYPGKRKLIVCGFHEATLAGYAAAALVFPDRRAVMQYTTTSPRLHALLGVTGAASNA